MRLDRSEWQSRLHAMTSQELHHIQVMTMLTQRIERAEIVPRVMFLHEPSDSIHAIHGGQSEKRIVLERRIWPQIQRIS